MQVLLVLLMVVLLTCVSSIYYIRLILIHYIHDSIAQLVISSTNVILMMMFSKMNLKLTWQLTEWENHRLEVDFEKSRVLKIFVFQCVNCYASLYYLLFITLLTDTCSSSNDCQSAVLINLSILFSTKLLTENWLTKVFVPSLSYYRQVQFYQQRIMHPTMTQIEREWCKLPIELDDYVVINGCDQLIQSGYVSMFASLLPILAIYAVVVQGVKIDLERKVWMSIYQRPVPRTVTMLEFW